MKFGYVQNCPVFGQIPQNCAAVEKLLLNKKADLIILPELFASGYAFQNKDEVRHMAENTNDFTANFLIKLAIQTGAVIVGGFVEEENNIFYNSSLIVDKNGVIGTYRKIHLFNKEHLYFSPGNRPFQVFDCKKFKLGVMICFDWVFPESARSLALLGADIIAHPSNLVLPYCQNTMLTRSLENGTPSITANRIGTESRGEDNFTFSGQSQIVDHKGNILISANSKESVAHFSKIQLNNDKRLTEYNHVLEDRKPDLYTS